MARKKAPPPAVDLVEHVSPRHFMRYEHLRGTINGKAYWVYSPMGSTEVYIEIEGHEVGHSRQFSVAAIELVKAIYLQLVVPSAEGGAQ